MLAISSFPTELQPTLTEAFDADGDGFIDTSELLAAAQLHKETKYVNSLLRKGLLVAGVLTVRISGASSITFKFVLTVRYPFRPLSSPSWEVSHTVSLIDSLARPSDFHLTRNSPS